MPERASNCCNTAVDVTAVVSMLFDPLFSWSYLNKRRLRKGCAEHVSFLYFTKKGCQVCCYLHCITGSRRTPGMRLSSIPELLSCTCILYEHHAGLDFNKLINIAGRSCIRCKILARQCCKAFLKTINGIVHPGIIPQSLLSLLLVCLLVGVNKGGRGQQHLTLPVHTLS